MTDQPRRLPPLDDETLAPRFVRFLRIALAITAVFLVANVIGAVVWHDSILRWGSLTLGGFFVIGALGLRYAHRNRLDVAAQLVAVGTLAMTVPLAMIVPYGAAAVALVVVLAVTAVLGYVRPSQLRNLMIASVCVSVLTGVISSLVPQPIQPPSIALAALRATGPAATTFVIFLLLMQYGDRLSLLLDREAHARRQAEEATRHAEKLVAELREAVTARDEFLAIASHELRTPLTSLKLQSEMLLRTARSANAAQIPDATVAMIARQTNRLVTLVDSLLDVTRITTGKLEIHREEMDIVALVNEVISRARDQIERTGAVVTVRGDAQVVGRFDPARLDTVMSNLLGNALKYGSGKPIDVTVVADETMAHVTFRDQGIGIPPEMHAKVFERFERAVPAKNYGGLGLGLWIVRQIAEAHGGSVRVTSERGAGATFTVDLPLRETMPPGAA